MNQLSSICAKCGRLHGPQESCREAKAEQDRMEQAELKGYQFF